MEQQAHPSSTPARVDIAIAGAGASGLLSLAQAGRVAAQHGVHLHVALIDPSPPDAAGLAYSTIRPENLMNVRACRLSAFDDEPDHFVEWMSAQGTPIHPEGFAPRMTYGRYLRSVAHDATDPTTGAVAVHRIHQRCTGIAPADADSGGVITLELESGQHVVTDQLVLALGNARPVPLAGPASVMIDDPWDDARLSAIQPDDDVVVIGTGLTAVDTLLALRASGHRGQTTIVSRHGRWPAAHVASPATCTVPSPRTLDFAGFRQSNAGPAAGPSARSIVANIRQALAERGDDDWQNVIDRVRPHTVRLWRLLDDTERARFIRHARPLWETHRHRMAPVIAEQLDAILADDRATTLAGRVTEITTDGLLAKVKVDQHGRAVTITARWVINCTGPSADIRRRDDTLVQSLLQQGHASPGWRGWGLDVDECGRLRNCTELGQTSISAIGPLRLGADYETTAIPEIRCQAAALAARLVQQRVHAYVA